LDNGFESVAFTSVERTILSALDASLREEWTSRLWCAKEAVAKALGRGMAGGPRELEIQNLDLSTGLVNVELSKELITELPHLAGRNIAAHTAREGTFVFASSII
jgi:phosphopantetheinyl transferase